MDKIPTRMKAIVVDEKDRAMSWRDVDVPPLDEGEVLVEVHASAVNRADLLQRAGGYAPPPGASEVLGLEAAGRVAALGSGAEGLSVGDEVCCLLAGGGYAEYVACPAPQLLPIPGALTMQQAAGLMEVFCTAYLNLYIEGELSPGERALVHAGASGVGTAAIQLCRALGNPVYATASASKLGRLRELGADEVIDRHGEDFEERVDALTGGRGVDVILDPVGGDYLERNIRALASRGRLVIIGLLGGGVGQLLLGPVLRRRLRVVGSVLRSRSVTEKGAILAALRERVWPLLEAGEVAPLIHEVVPIEQAGRAHELVASNATVGKVILEVRS